MNVSVYYKTPTILLDNIAAIIFRKLSIYSVRTVCSCHTFNLVSIVYVEIMM